MRQSAYTERDYSFGQQILSLRTASQLTQAGWPNGWVSHAQPSSVGKPARAIPPQRISNT